MDCDKTTLPNGRELLTILSPLQGNEVERLRAEKLEQALTDAFPQARIGRLDRDVFCRRFPRTCRTADPAGTRRDGAGAEQAGGGPARAD